MHGAHIHIIDIYPTLNALTMLPHFAAVRGGEGYDSLVREEAGGRATHGCTTVLHQTTFYLPETLAHIFVLFFVIYLYIYIYI